MQNIDSNRISAQFCKEGFSSGAEGKQTKQDHDSHCHPEDAGQRCYMVIPVSQFQQFGIRGDAEEKYPDPFFDGSAIDRDDKSGKNKKNGKEILPFRMIYDCFETFPCHIEAQQEEGQKVDHTGQCQEFSDGILIVGKGSDDDCSCQRNFAGGDLVLVHPALLCGKYRNNRCKRLRYGNYLQIEFF